MKFLYVLSIVAIVASSSMASSFGTNLSKQRTSLPLRQKKLPSAFHIRGGSDSIAASDVSTASDSSTSIEAAAEPNEPSVTEVEEVTINPMGPKATPPGFLRSTFPSIPWHTFPDLLTYARCLAIPALVAQYYCSTHPQKHIHSSLIFAIASITDFLDGYLARRWDICSPFGAFLDPVADKLMVSTALVLLAGTYGKIVAIPSSIILAREIAVSALREWMASKGLRDSVKVGYQGKVKAALTMVAISVVLAVPASFAVDSLWDKIMKVAMAMLYASSVITVTSGSVYFKAAAPALMGKE